MVLSSIQRLSLDGNKTKSEISLPIDAIPLWIDNDDENAMKPPALYYRLNNPQNAKRYQRLCVFNVTLHQSTDLAEDAKFLNKYYNEQLKTPRYGFYSVGECSK